jgi:hypothetical protein
MTVADSSRSPGASPAPPSRTPRASTSATLASSRTSTPTCSSCLRALARSSGGVALQDRVAALDQHDPGLRRVDVAEVLDERPPRDLGQGAGDLDAGGPRAHHHEGELPAPLLGVPGPLGALIGHEDPAADVEGVVDGLEAGRGALPGVVPEVRVARAGREHEPVVAEVAVAPWPLEGHAAGARVDLRDLAEHHPNVLLLAEDAADGHRDVGGGQHRRGHLVQQRLEQVVVATVNENDVYISICKGTSRVQTAEATPDHHHTGPSVQAPGEHGARRPAKRSLVHASSGDRRAKRARYPSLAGTLAGF